MDEFQIHDRDPSKPLLVKERGKLARSSGITGWLRVLAWVLIPVEFMTSVSPLLWASVVESSSGSYSVSQASVNRDPIEVKGGINLYAYVGNNPVNKVDPLGLAKDPKDPCQKFVDRVNDLKNLINGYDDAKIAESSTLAKTLKNLRLMTTVDGMDRSDLARWADAWYEKQIREFNDLQRITRLEKEVAESDLNKCRKNNPPPSSPPVPKTVPVEKPAPKTYPKPTTDKREASQVTIWGTILAATIIVGSFLILNPAEP